MKSLPVPIPSLRRLPIYYQHLLEVIQSGDEYISSEELGNATGCAPEQVRKDLSYLSGQGKSRIGYSTHSLADAIVSCLGLVNEKPAVLVGVGNLGKALALYPGFSQYGLKILYLFDNNPKVIGEIVSGFKVLSSIELANTIKTNNIQIGIITTPPKSAREVASVMTDNGIKAIWNFSTAHLQVPVDVMVRNVDLSLELAVISHYISGLSK